MFDDIDVGGCDVRIGELDPCGPWCRWPERWTRVEDITDRLEPINSILRRGANPDAEHRDLVDAQDTRRRGAGADRGRRQRVARTGSRPTGSTPGSSSRPRPAGPEVLADLEEGQPARMRQRLTAALEVVQGTRTEWPRIWSGSVPRSS